MILVSVEELRVIIACVRFCLNNKTNPLIRAEVFKDDQDLVEAEETYRELKRLLHQAEERMPKIDLSQFVLEAPRDADDDG